MRCMVYLHQNGLLALLYSSTLSDSEQVLRQRILRRRAKLLNSASAKASGIVSRFPRTLHLPLKLSPDNQYLPPWFQSPDNGEPKEGGQEWNPCVPRRLGESSSTTSKSAFSTGRKTHCPGQAPAGRKNSSSSLSISSAHCPR